MPPHAAPDDPPLRAVAALDDFVAEIVAQARAARVSIPRQFFDWAAGEGSWVVERLVLRRLARHPAPAPGLETALRCAVRYWVAPYLVVRFEVLRPLFPELEVRTQGDEVTVLVRTGRWRCGLGAECAWKLCEG